MVIPVLLLILNLYNMGSLYKLLFGKTRDEMEHEENQRELTKRQLRRLKYWWVWTIVAGLIGAIITLVSK